MSENFKQILIDSGIPTEEAQIKQEFEALVEKENLITNTSKVSPFWRLITEIAIAPVKWLTEYFIIDVLPNLFVKTAKGIWLDLHCSSIGIKRKQATNAQGIITFTKESDVNSLTVKAGTIVQTERINDVIYRLIVTEDTVIPSGILSAGVPVIAEQAGSSYNLSSGYYRVLPEYVIGIKSAENKNDWLTYPGADEETDDELRERYRVQFASVGQHHVDNVYRSMIAKVVGLSVDRIYFKHDAPRGAGSANAYILLDTGVVSKPFVDTINHYITNEGNHGHGDDLICYAMPETYHTLSCSLYFKPSDVISAERKQEIIRSVENIIRCAFRENNNYKVTKTYPFSRFSWSKLSEEIHELQPEISSIIWGQQDIKSELSIPRIQKLTVVENV